MSADTVLLPLCVGLSLLGLILTGVAWRRGNKGRVLQGAGLALAPFALYLTGLLGLLWDAVVAIFQWAGGIVLSPPIWIGFSLLGVCVVLWVVGGLIARRSAARKSVGTGRSTATPGQVTRGTASSASSKSSGSKSSGSKSSGSKSAKGPAAEPEVDDEMAEIEALLKARGIE